LGLVVGQSLRDAVTNGTGLARQTATGDGGDDVVLIDTLGGHDGLLQDHLQNRTREIGSEFLAVDGDLARTGLHPDAGNSILALAGGIGAAVGVELLGIDRRVVGSRIRRSAEVFERINGLGHDYFTLTFLVLSAATS